VNGEIVSEKRKTIGENRWNYLVSVCAEIALCLFSGPIDELPAICGGTSDSNTNVLVHAKYPTIASCNKKLASLRLFHSKDNTVRALQTDSSTSRLHCLRCILYLEDAPIWGDSSTRVVILFNLRETKNKVISFYKSAIELNEKISALSGRYRRNYLPLRLSTTFFSQKKKGIRPFLPEYVLKNFTYVTVDQPIISQCV